MSAEAVAWGEESSDAELITAARGGDSNAFGALYERHAGAARTVARQYTRSSADADDVVSDAFARVYSVVRGGGGPDVAFRAYLFTVVRRLAHTRVDAGRRVQPTDDMATFESAFGPVEGVDDPALAGFERGVVAKAYGSLPERWQAVLWYTEIERLPPAQVAPLLGLTANGVAALAYRAREGLREAYLQQHLVAAPSEGCRTINGKLGAYVRGGLAKRESAQVRAHLETCEACRGLVLELGDVNHGLRGIIAPLVLGVAGLGALASPMPVGVLMSVAGGAAGGAAGTGAAGGGAAGAATGAGAAGTGAGGTGAVGTGAGVGTGAAGAAGTGTVAGGGAVGGASASTAAGGVAAGSAGTGTAAGSAAAGGSAAAAGWGAGGAGASGAAAGAKAVAGSTIAGSTAAGGAVAGTTATAAGTAATSGVVGAAGTAVAAGPVAGATGAVTGVTATTAGATAAGATAMGATAAGATAAGATAVGAVGAVGATVSGVAGAAAGGATAALGTVATAGGATAMVGAGATSGLAAGIGGLLAALPGGVAGAVTAGVVGVSLAVGGAIAEPATSTSGRQVASEDSAAGGAGSQGVGASGGTSASGSPGGSGGSGGLDGSGRSGRGDQGIAGLFEASPLALPPTAARPAADGPRPDGTSGRDPDRVPERDADPVAEPAPARPGAPADTGGGTTEPAPPPPGPASFRASGPGRAIQLVLGTVSTVSVTIVNAGESGATDLRAALVLPAGVDPVDDFGGGPDDRWERCADDAPGGPAEFCLESLPAGSSSLLSTDVRVDPGAPVGPTTIGVDVGAAGVATQALAVPATVRSGVTDLVLGGPPPVTATAGTPFTLAFTVGTADGAATRDLDATVDLPAGVRWARDPSQVLPWDCESRGSGVVCRLSDLGPAGAPLTLTLVANPSTVGVPGLAVNLTVSDRTTVRSLAVPLAVVAPPAGPVDPPPVVDPVDPPPVPDPVDPGAGVGELPDDPTDELPEPPEDEDDEDEDEDEDDDSPGRSGDAPGRSGDGPGRGRG